MADPLSLSRLLMYGSEATRRSVADGPLEYGGADDWAMLAATVRSNEPGLLRGRCLEVLGVPAAAGDEPTAATILAALLNEGGAAHVRNADPHGSCRPDGAHVSGRACLYAGPF